MMFSSLQKKFVFISLLTFASHLAPQIFCYHPEAEELLQRLKKKYDAKPVSRPLQNIIDEIVKKSGLKEEVVFLESEKIRTSKVSSAKLYPWPKFLLIQTHVAENEPRYLDHITFDIWHEIGHVVNGDQDDFLGVNKKDALSTAFLATSIAAGISAYRLLGKYTKAHASIKIFAALCSLKGTLHGAELVKNYLQCRREDAADAFAYEKLLENGQYPIVLSQIASFLAYHNSDPKSGFFIKLFNSHPSNLNRALQGLKQLEKNGHNVKELISKGSPEFRQHFADTMKKYCPEFYAEKFA